MKLSLLAINPYTLYSCGVDPAFGSSSTAIVLTEILKEEHKIRVIYAKEYDTHPNPAFIGERLYDIYVKYRNTWFYIDDANRGFITELKTKFNEDSHYKKAEDVGPDNNRVLPFNFTTDHKNMLSHLHLIVNKGMLCVPEKYDRVIISLHTATAEEYKLIKKDSSYNDSLDALRLACKGFQISSSYGLG